MPYILQFYESLCTGEAEFFALFRIGFMLKNWWCANSGNSGNSGNSAIYWRTKRASFFIPLFLAFQPTPRLDAPLRWVGGRGLLPFPFSAVVAGPSTPALEASPMLWDQTPRDPRGAPQPPPPPAPPPDASPSRLFWVEFFSRVKLEENNRLPRFGCSNGVTE